MRTLLLCAVSAAFLRAEPIRIALAGDVMLGRLVNEQLRYRPPAHPWGDTLPLFQAADVRICNLECVISDRGRRWTATPKVFHFRSDAKNVAVLRAAGMDAVSLANNHVLDYGYEALLDMFGLLEKAGVRYAGAGRDDRAACAPVVLSSKGLRVGLLAFTDNEPVWEAQRDRPGTCYVPVDLKDARARRLLEAVRRADAETDVLVVSAHWGGNWGYEPPPEHVPFGRALVEAGADIVFGHSAHVFRGIEIYRGRPILYSAGDFVDDYMVDEVQRNDETFLFVVEAGAERVHGLRLHPILIRYLQSRRASGADAARIASRMRALCAKFGTLTGWDPTRQVLEIPIP
ncbi:MAG: CapA family protein [Bryobacterales bacterium]|nr:CapA family protein [Bryobacteraceae bacterium]MDW8354970.1 CapA family protein [Bryobacterales bacterium]